MPGLETAVGRRVRQAREKAGLTQEDFAQRVGIAVTTLSRYETGRLAFTLKVLERVSQVLRVSVASLVDEDTTAPKIRDDELSLLGAYRTLSPAHRRMAVKLLKAMRSTR